MAQSPVRTKRTNRKRISAAYVSGNVVYKPDAAVASPRRRAERPGISGQPGAGQKKAVKRKVFPVEQMYVALFTICAVVTVLVCTMYIREQARMIAKSEKVASMQLQLATLTEKNDSAYNAVDATVNLEAIRQKAVDELGMVPVSEGSVITYSMPEDDSIRQYSLIPKAGILSKSAYK